MSIKYYHLAKGETPPEEFCAVRDVSGEPSEYEFYVPESDVAKLRELVYDMLEDEERGHNDDRTFFEHVERARDFGIKGFE